MFLSLLEGNLIHPLIERNHLRAISDIATGTGIWLQDVRNAFDNARPFPLLQGFDVSSAQFPSDLDKLSFSVQNVLNPFPPDELNRYDLVHVRFLQPGLEESDYQLAVTNMVSIIKPGGYLQWEEEDCSRSFKLMTTIQPQLQEIVDDYVGYAKFHGFSLNAPEAIVKACVNADLKVISKTFQNTVNAPPEQLSHIRSFFRRSLAMVLPVAYCDQGLVHDEHEGQTMYHRKISKVMRLFEEGLVLDDVFASILCQKA
ncbi:uncharacterized protein N7500_004457 [Penicillium coprophilum]|uniref:uncharacterized protein n=1 Tax=Penicillium coprophilum TaxID=36646 RepID=UPI0023A16741|nr:uncharacterized protein N7500_004457 [Penicillium coprophilum]KAJ5162627.1 hypothetical protein N7500_004457 [Penicillium coprophilum]